MFDFTSSDYIPLRLLGGILSEARRTRLQLQVQVPKHFAIRRLAATLTLVHQPTSLNSVGVASTNTSFMSASISHLTELPIEILEQILLHLPGQDIIKMEAVRRANGDSRRLC